ncbi:DUF362 domain-containing protein [Elusimicrobiota bacterium]
MKKISRREFLKTAGSWLAGMILGVYKSKVYASGKYLSQFKKAKDVKAAAKPAAGTGYSLSVITGNDPAQNVRMAVEPLGTMKQFVKPGNIVVVKPNMSWDRTPEQAANTDPGVVKEVVKMCFEAGAKKVKIFDRCCSNDQRAYKNSGVADAAREAGADVFHVDEWNFVNAEFDYKSPLEGWPLYRDAVTADCFINLPVLKHHRLTGLTLSMKNLMGIMGGVRGEVHWNIHEKLVHVTDYISPSLTIIDATRVLMANGPSGGNLEDVKIFNTIIAGIDPVLVDSEAARLVGKDPMSIGYIKEGKKFGLGNIVVEERSVFRKKV